MKIELPFSHPIKELIWVVQDNRWINILLQLIVQLVIEERDMIEFQNLKYLILIY